MKKPASRAARRVAQPRRAAGERAQARGARAATPAVLVLPAHFDIRCVAGVARALRERVARGEPVLVDAREVTGTDTAALQLLLAARHAAQARSLAFEWCGVSDALRAASSTIGLGEALGLP